MKNYALRSLSQNHQTKFLHRYIIREVLAIAGIILLTVGTEKVQAQSNPSGSLNNTSPSLDRISPGQFNNIQPVRQPNFPVDSGGSQQFFEGGQDRIYFLPEEESEPILEIDKTIEADGVRYEDLQKKSDNE